MKNLNSSLVNLALFLLTGITYVGEIYKRVKIIITLSHKSVTHIAPESINTYCYLIHWG